MVEMYAERSHDTLKKQTVLYTRCCGNVLVVKGVVFEPSNLRTANHAVTCKGSKKKRLTTSRHIRQPQLEPSSCVDNSCIRQ